MNIKPQFTIGTFGIIFDNQQKVLLCHRRDYDLWNLPGGTLESNESPWQGVVREVKEETGMEIEIVQLMGVYSKSEKNEIVFSFTCRKISGELTLNAEADRIEYFSIDQIPLNTSPKQVERIKDALRGEFVYKTQSGKSSIELIKEGRL